MCLCILNDKRKNVFRWLTQEHVRSTKIVRRKKKNNNRRTHQGINIGLWSKRIRRNPKLFAFGTPFYTFVQCKSTKKNTHTRQINSRCDGMCDFRVSWIQIDGLWLYAWVCVLFSMFAWLSFLCFCLNSKTLRFKAIFLAAAYLEGECKSAPHTQTESFAKTPMIKL